MYKYEKEKLISLMGEVTYNELKKMKAFLAGGAILSLFSGTEIKDFDLYFRSKGDAFNFYICNEGQAVISYTKRSMIIVGFTIPRNLILFKYFNSLEEIFESFDFTICMAGFDFETEEFVFDPRFHRDIIGRKLIYSGTNMYPIGSLLRIHKYKEKGFHISRREMIKIALKTSFLNLTCIEDVENHIQGMYGINLKEEWEKKGYSEFNEVNVMDFISTIKILPFKEGKYLCIAGYPENDVILFGSSRNDGANMVDSSAIDEEDYQIKIYKDLCPTPSKVYKIGEMAFIIAGSNYMKMVYVAKDDEEDIIHPIQKLDSFKMYKNVKKKGSKLISYWQSDFEYVVGEEIEAVMRGYYGRYSSGIYGEIAPSVLPHSNDANSVILELEVKYDDMIFDFYDSAPRAKKVFVKREISKEEYEKITIEDWIKDNG
jgi:hypothetical protein